MKFPTGPSLNVSAGITFNIGADFSPLALVHMDTLMVAATQTYCGSKPI
jgi:hypothetical protein